MAAAAVALMTALAAALTGGCCFGVDSGLDLGSWASRGTLGLAWGSWASRETG